MSSDTIATWETYIIPFLALQWSMYRTLEIGILARYELFTSLGIHKVFQVSIKLILSVVTCTVNHKLMLIT